MRDMEDFAALEPFFAAYVNRLDAKQRKKVFLKIGQETRRMNAKRISANVEPDGSGMVARKRHTRMKDRKGRSIRTTKMFRNIGKTRSLKVYATDDGVEVGFGWNRFTNHLALTHQEGRKVPIGRMGARTGGGSKAGNKIYAKYPIRRLLGFGPDDLEMITDYALKLLEG